MTLRYSGIGEIHFELTVSDLIGCCCVVVLVFVGVLLHDVVIVFVGHFLRYFVSFFVDWGG